MKRVLSTVFLFFSSISAHADSGDDFLNECWAQPSFQTVLKNLGYSRVLPDCSVLPAKEKSECIIRAMGQKSQLELNCTSLYSALDGYLIYLNDDEGKYEGLNYAQWRQLPGLSTREDVYLNPVSEVFLMAQNSPFSGLLLKPSQLQEYASYQPESYVNLVSPADRISFYSTGKTITDMCYEELYHEINTTESDAAFLLNHGIPVIATIGKYRVKIKDAKQIPALIALSKNPSKLQELTLQQALTATKNSNLSSDRLLKAWKLTDRVEKVGYKVVADPMKAPYPPSANIFCSASYPSFDNLFAMIQLSTDMAVSVIPAEDLTPTIGLDPDHHQLKIQGIEAFVQTESKNLSNLQAALLGFMQQGGAILSRQSFGAIAGAFQLMEDMKNLRIAFGTKADTIALLPDGRLVPVKTALELRNILMGKFPVEEKVAKAVFPKKKQLVLVYDVTPFGLKNKTPFAETSFGYDASIYAAMQSGSDADTDIVFIRSDLPIKKNLLIEYVSHGKTQLIERLDPRTDMSKKEVLQAFLTKMLTMFPEHESIRLHVSGHGGAEKGLLPDSAKEEEGVHVAGDSIMRVEQFAAAIHDSLEEHFQRTGKRRFVDDIVMSSCLMSNSSFVYALMGSGARYLAASPEVMMGNVPQGMFSKSLTLASASAQDYAKAMANFMVNAPSMNIPDPQGDGKDSPHAFSYNVSDLNAMDPVVLKNDFRNFLQVVMQSNVDRGLLISKLDSTDRYVRIPFMEELYGKAWPQRDWMSWIDAVVSVVPQASPMAQILKADLEKISLGHWTSPLDSFKMLGLDMTESYEKDRSVTLYFPGSVKEYADTKTSHTTSFVEDSGYWQFLDWLYAN